MLVPPGHYDLGPGLADLLVRTTRTGIVAPVGHDLTLTARSWSARLAVGPTVEQCHLTAEVDLGSLAVLSGRGGAVPLTPGNIADIERNARATLDTVRHPTLSFVSDTASGHWESLALTGALTVHGVTRRHELAVTAQPAPEPGQLLYQLRTGLRQSDYGIVPFSAFLGAIRVADEVTVEVTVAIDTSPDDPDEPGSPH